MRALLQRSIAKSSYGTYNRAWANLTDFFLEVYGYEPELPLSVEAAAMFITYLDLQGYASATVHTYFSSINHMHRLKGGQHLTSLPLMKKLLDGVDKGQSIKPVRAPITVTILEKLLDAVPRVVYVPHDIILFQAIFVNMYFLCARVGEIAVSQGQRQNVLLYKDVSFHYSHHNLKRFTVNFHAFKHNKTGKIHSIPVEKADKCVCPVKFMEKWLEIRGCQAGPLFSDNRGNMVTASQVAKTLKKTLQWVGLDSKTYGTHSFRIGRCSDLAKQGASEAKIKFYGRFHSDAFLKYIRPQIFGE